MSTLLENLAELVKMIFGVLVTPNYGAVSENYNLLRWIYSSSITDDTIVRGVILLTFGIGLCGVSIGLIKRLLWKS